MSKFTQAVLIAAIMSLLIGLMIRTSGWAAIPVVFAFGVVLAYAAYSIVRGKETPYPRLSIGVFARIDTAPINLSTSDFCVSCTDETGEGLRETTYTELVFLGVPLVLLSETDKVLCHVCHDPMNTAEQLDSIDRELEGERA
jgi:hypothetical protein